MEAPAIVTALWLASRGDGNSRMGSGMWREILLKGSIVLLLCAFTIGLITGREGMREVESFIVTPFKAVPCLFLLDIGLVAGRALLQSRNLITRGLVASSLKRPCNHASPKPWKTAGYPAIRCCLSWAAQDAAARGRWMGRYLLPLAWCTYCALCWKRMSTAYSTLLLALSSGIWVSCQSLIARLFDPSGFPGVLSVR